MLKIKQAILKLPETTSVILYGLNLFWQCDKLKTCSLFFMILLESLLGPLLIWLSAKILDEITLTSFNLFSWNTLIWMAVVYFTFTLIIDALQPVVEMQKRLFTFKLQAHIDTLLITRAISFPDITPFEQASFHSRTQIVRYNEYFVNMWITIVTQFLSGVTLIIAGSTLIGMFAPWAPILFLFLSFPKMYLEAKINNLTFEGREEIQELRRRAEYYLCTPLMHETAGEMKVFNLVPFFKSRYSSTAKHLLQTISNDQKKLTLHQFFWSLLQSMVAGGILIYIVQQALQGQLSSGDILLFIGAIIQFNEGINELFAVFAIGPRETRHLRKIVSFLTSENKIKSGNTLPDDAIDKGYELNKITFSYNAEKEVLKIEELQIPKGKITVLVGENGSGKSTIIKLLLRYFDPNEGTIHFNTLPLSCYDIENFRLNSTAVFQDFLRYEMDFKSNIGVGKISKFNDLVSIEKAASLGGANQFLHKLEKKYETELGRLFGGKNLSGGEWQRIALSRAFMRHESANLLIFDEPTSALDVFIEEEIFEKLRKLAYGKTVIIVSHRLSTARFADNIIFLEKGKVVEIGTHDELIKNQAHYAELYKLQAQKYK